MAEGKLTVIGAGTMGRGIAQVAAMAGYNTSLLDLSEAQLEDAQQGIEAALAKGVAKEKLSRDEAHATRERLRYASRPEDGLAGAEIVIEAVPEEMSLKQKVLQQAEELSTAGALIGTNTSSLSVSELAGALKDPSRCIGMHFFNPPHIVKLLEVVKAEQTSEASLDETLELGRAMQRELVVVNDSPGFASSRLGLVLGLEAIRMVEEGVASAEDIDRAMTAGYRHPMGPLKLTDLVGLDVRLDIANYLHEKLGSPQFKPPELMQTMVAEGKLGKKSGQGFYTWD